MSSLKAGWDNLGRRQRAVLVVGAPIVLYLLLYTIVPGTNSYLDKKAPHEQVVIGAIYGTANALLAIGLILIYRTNRFINFSYAAMGSLFGYMALMLHRQDGVPYFVVFPIAVVLGVLLGGVTEVVVIRRFRDSSRLIITVASIGLAQLLGGIEFIVVTKANWPAFTGSFELPIRTKIPLGNTSLFGDQILILVVVPFVIAGLAWFLLKTDAGVAVRAAAENADRALLLGIPIRRLSTMVWMVAGGLATLTFLLKAPFAGASLSIAQGPVVLLPALAAAVVARMESLPIAFATGVALGIVEAIVRNQGEPTVATVVVFVVILVVLLLQRAQLSRALLGEGGLSFGGVVKGTPSELRHLPEVRWAKLGVVAVVVALLLWVPSTFGPGSQLNAVYAMVFAMAGVSLVIMTGWGGHISLGQFAFVGIGAVVAGNLISNRVDLIFALVAAGLAGGVLALIVGLPALRIRGPFLAVTTLAFAVALDSWFLNPTERGSIMPSLRDKPFLWERFDLGSNYTLYLTTLAFLGLSILAAQGVRRARSGRVVIATRDNQRAADAAAVPTMNVKLSAFLLSGVIVGVGGAFYILAISAVGQNQFEPWLSLEAFTTSVIGGLGSVSGAIAGVLLFRFLASWQALAVYRQAATGVGLLIVLYVLPGGIGQLMFSVRDRYLRWVAARRGIVVPSLVADKRVEGASEHAADEVDLLAGALFRLTGGVHAMTLTDPTLEVPVAGGSPLLDCTGVDVSYGPVQILFGVDFAVAEGEIVALLGTNGAGKSTILKAICGLVKPKRGRVMFAGEDVTNLPADVTTHRGIASMPGGKGVFPTLSVAENLRLAAWLIRNDAERVEQARGEVETLFPILRQRSSQMAGNLSGGEQQMLALGGALMTKPRLLMIDELSLGLAPTIVGQLLEVVREIHRRGTTIVIVEQSINVALNLAERAVFMEKGEVRFEGPTADLLDRPDILRSVFIAGANAAAGDNGDTAPVARLRDAEAVAEDASVVLECREVIKRFGGITAVDHVNLALRDGEILGLIGHNGAGKTTLMDCISGFNQIEGGRIFLRARDVTDFAPHERALGGLGRSFQDALLYPTLTVAETVAVARERHLANRDLVAAAFVLPASYESELAVMAKVDELVELMGLGAFRDKLTGELSTGSRRIVDLACILAQDPKVLMLDEPSGGVAQKETEALGPLLLRVREHTGCSVLVIEHDMPLLSSICDRMIALELGGVIAEGPPAEVLEHPSVIESYLGTDDSAINRSGAAGAAGAKPRAATPTRTNRPPRRRPLRKGDVQ